MHVKVRYPFSDPLGAVGAIYGFVPMVFSIYVLIALVRGNFEPLIHGELNRLHEFDQYCIVTVYVVILDEGLLKNVIRQPQPTVSASTSYGIASGRAISSTALLSMLWLRHGIWS
jgi:hypothetical protein